MKKTLIALMALAGIACGASTIDAQWVTAPATAGDFYAGAWTFTFTLDETYTIADSGYILGAWWSPSPNSSGVGSNAIYLTETEGVLTLNVGRGGLNNTDLDKTTKFTQFNDGNASDYVVRSEAIERGVTYTLPATLTKADSDKSGMLTISDNIGGTWTAETGDTAWYKNNMSGANSGASQSMAYGVNSGVAVVTPSIPEPATATLSLLALAGLCARRRRA